MIRLKLMLTADSEDDHAQEFDAGLLHGTAILKSSVFPWARSERIVYADNYLPQLAERNVS